MKLLVKENDKLHLKLDSLSIMTSSTNLQLTKLETAISNLTSTRQNESTNLISACSCDQMMDILRNVSDSNTCQKSDMKSILPLPTNCAEAIKHNGYKSGSNKIFLPESKLEPFFVFCLADPDQFEAPWTIIQRRQDGSVDFFRNWTDYQKGFGNLDGEFFIGLDILHALTQSTPHELWIEMISLTGARFSANYSRFAIGDSSEAYTLKILGTYQGNVGDSLKYNVGQKFSTKDMDNDLNSDRNCADIFKGAWWWNEYCQYSNLNGRYMGSYQSQLVRIFWFKTRKYSTYKYVHMAIRPVQKNK